MRVLIVEDELPAQRMLSAILQELASDITIAAVKDSVESTVEWLRNNEHPDLIFLDIHLSDGLSFNIFKHIEPESMIVFITAYDQYALNAFTVNSIDYLLKPVKKADIERTIEKYRNLSQTLIKSRNSSTDFSALIEQVKLKKSEYRSRFLISIGDELLTVPVENIAFFLSIQSSTYAFTHKNRKYMLDLSLEKLSEQLNPDKFFRTSRKSIVNIDSIKKIEQWFNGKLMIKTDPPATEDIVISRDRTPVFKEWLDR